MEKVALVTCQELPEPDPDQELLLQALRQEGLHAEMLAWDGPDGSPEKFDLCVLRSCWNYHERPQEFLSWIAAAAASTRLVNPLEVVRWNLHKSYLQKLRDAGVPIIPTVIIDKGEAADLQAIVREHGWREVVVKPAVSVSSFRTKRFGADDLNEGRIFLKGLVAERDAMVQRYMPAVEDRGERALVWIDGELTHAVRKSPRFADGVEQVSGALPVSAGEADIASRALSCVDGQLLYARVDVLDDREREPVVSELELLEPSLFLQQNPAGLERFVAAIGRICRT